MKSTTISFAIGALAATVAAAPTAIDYTPPGGWGSVDYSNVDYSKVDFTKVDYSHVDYSKVDWTKVDYSQVDYSKIDWSKVDYGNKGYGQWDSAVKIFTSTYSVIATPDQVVNGTGAATTFTGGLKGSKGFFNYGIIADSNTICYRIEIYGFRGNYQSPATTATHIHQAAKGQNGSPRIAFPNPVAVDEHKPEGKRVSVGCVSGPFTTGVITNGADTGTGFHVSQIEKDPKGFFTDIHSSLAVPGAFRGQLA
ncbi:hypothetical protein JX265_003999 [Neoarthrinium moseri]|uniref:CHRD domain-containing protein n=1 Tax=Neoarthrinium moseri TaxID=1658444 RepID=A0A9Q0ARX5_9PEZI|nr:uncharacterized protein JN550_006752 [Neoarthrinium moseri]KAI1853667.1 hypothetical protein JX266_001651 [Neoarthrinium moseri]KAI1867945.1 hypothetical protein JN550_006752 [Neoarthrinium moseri]KAI1876473.1 hypothetical protein JX265_003999 [Neoarthrinium moseri]